VASAEQGRASGWLAASALELETKAIRRFPKIGEGPYKDLLLVESAF